MKVTLKRYTPDALDLLLATKETRLGGTDDPARWSEERKAEHLQYMLGTIKSSWEFVDYVFHISGVSRAFTHQLVRTRQGSYAQESQRTVDARDNGVVLPEFETAAGELAFTAITDRIFRAYAEMIDAGEKPQNARAILPTATATSIWAKFNLRTLSDMARVRLCTRTQGEYQRVFREMCDEVVAVHPWAEPFLAVECVASGTCAFPNYGPDHCPIYHPSLDRTEVKRQQRERFFTAPIHEAAPQRGKDSRSIG